MFDYIKSMLKRNVDDVLRPAEIEDFKLERRGPLVDQLHEWTVDGPIGGRMLQERLDRREEGVNIQKLYKQHRKEVDDKMDNFMLPRETVQERRARVETLK